MHHQKSALFGSKTCMERSHSIFCTNRHKIDIITTRYLYCCSVVGLNTPTQEKTMEYSMVDRHLIFSFFIGTTDRGTIIADDMYACIELVCTVTTYL